MRELLLSGNRNRARMHSVAGTRSATAAERQHSAVLQGFHLLCSANNSMDGKGERENKGLKDKEFLIKHVFTLNSDLKVHPYF